MRKPMIFAAVLLAVWGCSPASTSLAGLSTDDFYGRVDEYIEKYRRRLLKAEKEIQYICEKTGEDSAFLIELEKKSPELDRKFAMMNRKVGIFSRVGDVTGEGEVILAEIEEETRKLVGLGETELSRYREKYPEIASEAEATFNAWWEEQMSRGR